MRDFGGLLYKLQELAQTDFKNSNPDSSQARQRVETQAWGGGHKPSNFSVQVAWESSRVASVWPSNSLSSEPYFPYILLLHWTPRWSYFLHSVSTCHLDGIFLTDTLLTLPSFYLVHCSWGGMRASPSVLRPALMGLNVHFPPVAGPSFSLHPISVFFFLLMTLQCLLSQILSKLWF